MNLINYDPFKTMNRLQDEINTFFQSHDLSPMQIDGINQWVPSVDLKEEKKQFVINADIPGVDPKDIDVSMQDNTLTIKGERKTEEQYDDDDYHRVECSYGSFCRRFNLPDTADSDRIKAIGVNGMLKVTVGKKTPSKAKTIEVNKK